MALQLVRPLCVFDLETTGLQITKDRIVQIAVIKLFPDGHTETFNELVNPCQPIPAEIAAIHGITNEMVADAPTFEVLAPRLIAFIDDADLAGYNSNKFDIPVLSEELLRCNIDFDLGARHFVDVQNIFHKMEQRTLAAAYQFYCGKQIENAHNALYDTLATLEVLQAQTEKYTDLQNDIAGLSKFSTVGNQQADFAGRLAYDENQEVCYNFGKHKGKTVAQVLKLEPGYYGWMLEADFPLYTKQVLRKEMERIKASNSSQNIEDKLELLKNKFKKPWKSSVLVAIMPIMPKKWKQRSLQSPSIFSNQIPPYSEKEIFITPPSPKTCISNASSLFVSKRWASISPLNLPTSIIHILRLA